jgi:hypothetical protein
MGQMYLEGSVACFRSESGEEYQRQGSDGGANPAIHDGDQGFVIRSGDQGFVIRSGDQGFVIRSGDQGFVIRSGDMGVRSWEGTTRGGSH